MHPKLLTIHELEASIEKTPILKKLTLEIMENEVHVIMGPNGSGKSTLAKILAGHPAYSVDAGMISFNNKNLLEMEPENRSHEGLFLAFQYPVEISGVTNYDFLRIAFNEKEKYSQRSEINPLEFIQIIDPLLENLEIKASFLDRNLNEGFSGGEKKKNEILQMSLLKPKLVILDEIDSGLDIDALKIICKRIIENLGKNASILIITHYPKILNYLQPTHIHIFMDGKIIQTGGMELVKQLEEEGYQSFRKKN